MPFAGYDNFDACVAANSDKDDPEAYCATIMRAVEKRAEVAQLLKHAVHDQSDHGNWARSFKVKDVEGVSDKTFDMREWKSGRTSVEQVKPGDYMEEWYGSGEFRLVTGKPARDPAHPGNDLDEGVKMWTVPLERSFSIHIPGGVRVRVLRRRETQVEKHAVHDQSTHGDWADRLTASGKKVVDRLVSSGTVDLARNLWDDETNSPGDFATEFDYEFEPSRGALEEARQYISAVSQAKLREMGLGPTIRVYRAGKVYPGSPTPTSLSRATAGSHSEYRGRDGTVGEYDIDISDVLYYSDALWRSGTFAEEEIGVMGDVLQRSQVEKHASHDQSTHGNWAHGVRNGEPIPGTGTEPELQEPGTRPIPPGYVRFYHYTKEPGIVDRIAEEGIKLGIGETYGEPNLAWGSTKLPQLDREFVEFAVPIEFLDPTSRAIPFEVDQPRATVGGFYASDLEYYRRKYPDRDPIEVYQEGWNDVGFGATIPPEAIVAVHKPWHEGVRSFLRYGESSIQEVLDGFYDNFADDPRYGPAIQWIKDNYGETPQRRGLSLDPTLAPPEPDTKLKKALRRLGIAKHGAGDQAPHGNWANGSGSSDRSDSSSPGSGTATATRERTFADAVLPSCTAYLNANPSELYHYRSPEQLAGVLSKIHSRLTSGSTFTTDEIDELQTYANVTGYTPSILTGLVDQMNTLSTMLSTYGPDFLSRFGKDLHFVRRFYKHYPGGQDHDQSRHGNRGGGLRTGSDQPGPSSPAPAGTAESVPSPTPEPKAVPVTQRGVTFRYVSQRPDREGVVWKLIPDGPSDPQEAFAELVELGSYHRRLQEIRPWPGFANGGTKDGRDSWETAIWQKENAALYEHMKNVARTALPHVIERGRTVAEHIDGELADRSFSTTRDVPFSHSAVLDLARNLSNPEAAKLVEQYEASVLRIRENNETRQQVQDMYDTLSTRYHDERRQNDDWVTEWQQKTIEKPRRMETVYTVPVEIIQRNRYGSPHLARGKSISELGLISPATVVFDPTDTFEPGYFSDKLRPKWSRIELQSDYLSIKADADAHREEVVTLREYQNLLAEEGERITNRSRRAYNAQETAVRELRRMISEETADRTDTAVLDVLSEYRDFGGQVDTPHSARAKGRRTLDIESKFFPSEWIERSNEVGKVEVVVRQSRAHYQHEHRTWNKNDSSFEWSSKIQAGGSFSSDDILHEMGHRFEYSIPEITALENAFYTHRTSGEQAQRLTSLLPGHGYGASEMSRPDDFTNPYMGRAYPKSNGMHAANGVFYHGQAHELLSMGLPRIYGRSSHDPGDLNKGLDDEMRAFILGMVVNV